MLEYHLHYSMGPRTLRIGTSRPTGPQLHAHLKCVHDGFNSVCRLLGQSNDVDLLLAILSAEDGGSLVQEVVQLATVDLIEGDVQFEVSVHV